MNNPWDARFSGEDFYYGEVPNSFFADFLSSVKFKGKILLPGEGEGRNAVYAAGLGWDVTAFDSSEVARAKALK
ncbi:MAG TPA: SAM-dependent methyltransferase, partial [Bacteroidales bacterium]|nr:SAM-dependent methyltransferase [Bacteroidales bacterium]